MVKRKIILLTLCALFVACVPFANYDNSSQFGMTSIFKYAYAQTPDPIDPGNIGGPGDASDPGNSGDPTSSANLGGPDNSSGPDPSAGDNSTNLSNPSDVSSGIGNGTNVMTQNDTSSGPDASIPVVPSNISNPSGNATTAQVVPEFGSISLAILVISIMSIIIISSRTRLRL